MVRCKGLTARHEYLHSTFPARQHSSGIKGFIWTWQTFFNYTWLEFCSSHSRKSAGVPSFSLAVSRQNESCFNILFLTKFHNCSVKNLNQYHQFSLAWLSACALLYIQFVSHLLLLFNCMFLPVKMYFWWSIHTGKQSPLQPFQAIHICNSVRFNNHYMYEPEYIKDTGFVC